jgi:mevalonate kinase
MKTIRTSAPGNLMLLGEHAVLHGHRALVCAVNRRMHATLTPRSDDQIHIRSALGHHTTTVNQLAPHATFRFVMTCISRQKDKLKTGFDLMIDSEFSHTVGLGSSAAVTVAMNAALTAWLDNTKDLRTLFLNSLAVIREVQGLGSGADVAASVYGGIVSYRAEPLEIEPLQTAHPLTVIYSGSKMPTVEVVRLVAARRKEHPELYDGIFRLMDLSTEQAIQAIHRDDWKTLGQLLNLNQGLMSAIGVSNAKLDEINWALRAEPGMLGSKISGSGLGDCVIGLGASQRTDWPYDVLPVEITATGANISS